MGDSENKKEYSQQQLAEIERIVGLVGEELESPLQTSVSAVSAPPRSRINEEEALDEGEFEEAASDDEIYADEGPSGEDVEDISDLIEEVDEAEAATITDKPFTEEISLEEEDVSGIEERKEAVTGSPMEQLEGLTRDEPESLDDQDISSDEFVTDELRVEPPPRKREEEPLEPDFDGMVEDVPLPKEVETEIPDLSDLSLREAGEMPEAREEDIPDIDLGDLGAVESAPERKREPEPDLGDDMIEDFGKDFEVSEAPEEPAPRGREKAEPLDNELFPEEGILDTLTSDGIGEMIEKEEKKPPRREPKTAPEPVFDEEEPFHVEMLDDEPAPETKPKAGRKETKDAVELSSGEMRRLKKAILLYNPSIRQAIKDTVINDLLPPKETKLLISMILGGKAEEGIQQYLEQKLKRKIILVDEAAVSGRKVITQRPEYTKLGRERQKRLLRMTKIGGIAALVSCVAMLLSYQFIYKPYMAKRKISEGVQLILKGRDYIDKQKYFPMAEKLFREVDEDYLKDYIEGYNNYGEAYFQVKEYLRSVDKFNRAYKIDPTKLDTLNSLGHYYSKVPEEVYRYLRGNVNGWYFGNKHPETAEYSQLDLAIHLFKRVLTRDRNNEKALYGIGRAFFHQGQFRKAQDYYRNIIKANPDSVVGYSGLLDLYIEYDSYNPNAFKLVVQAHLDMLDRNMIGELPKALLAKLAGYYLTKQATATDNVRISFGVVSPRFKDDADNIYPAVLSVLKVLNEKDPDYPPLHLQYARLNLTQKNYLVMKKYLDKALSLAPGYFGALHLTGGYYYYVKEPVQAYQFLMKAVNAYDNQPDFTRDEFYQETESRGNSYALLGNIFYYFSDKVVFRFGDIDDEIVEDDLEKMANYNIAKEKYEIAIAEKYESPELRYNLGRIYYLGRLYQKALDQWLHLYEDFVERPELMMALGNAFYHLGNYEASKGEYMKLISVFEYDADRIKIPSMSNSNQVKVFRSLSTAYNNLGAIYQLRENEAKSGICYWKSIDYAKRLETENEYARVNLARGFRERKTEQDPILDEDIPYSVDIYREDMR